MDKESNTVAPEFPRRFVRVGDPLSSWEQIAPYFDRLENAPINTPADLDRWMQQRSELASCIHEVATGRYVRMTCQTDDAERKAAYLDFVENIDPRCKPHWHALDCKFATLPAADKLPADRFEVFRRSVRTRVELFREENIPLAVEEAKLEQRYQEISGAMTVHYDGREQTLPQLSTYLERTDRTVRQQVWELSTRRRLQDADALDELFDELFRLRHRVARNAGFPDYRAYVFKAKERFDYTPDDCVAYHQAAEWSCVPVLRRENEVRRKTLGVDVLRPWDLSVDVKGRPPLKPCADTRELVDKCARVFDRLDAELGRQFRSLGERGDLDLDSRKGKAPGGYQSTFHESRRPFIFMNSVGMQRDVRTLLHEAGHAFHTLACRLDPLIDYRGAPMEFSEVASMAMEMLAYEHYNLFYGGEELERAKRSQLEGVVSVLPWIATIDAFQHWMYTHPDHTRDDRRAKWLELNKRFGGLEDYTGHEESLARGWHRQLHLFEAPFYYIEYGIAQLGALQVWQNAQRDPQGALRHYRAALALGGSRPLPALFKAANIRFDFSSATLQPLMDAVQKELDTLRD